MSEKVAPHPPVLVDNPEAYSKRFAVIHDKLMSVDSFVGLSPGYTEDQKKLVQLEATMFGVNPESNPQGFVGAHRQFASGAEADLQNRLPQVKEGVVDRVSSYFAGADESTKESLKELMHRRLADTKKVSVYDNLAGSRNIGGSFSTLSRQPSISLSEIVYAINTSRTPEEYEATIVNVIFAHEIMHGILTAGTQRAGFHDFTTIRNGLSLDFHTDPNDFMNDKTIKHGQWLNEAMIESFRRQIFQTEDVRYEPGVILLETLDELSPGLRDELVATALDVNGPGPVFGKVEELLGPTGIEKVEEALAKVERFSDFPEFKATVIGMLPNSLQAKASDVFSKKELEICGNRESYKASMQSLLSR